MAINPKDVTRPPGTPFHLDTFDPDDTGGYEKKKDARKDTEDNLERLQQLHEKLYASGTKGLLVVLQAMDTAGKDGTIKHALGAFNPQGVKVKSFGVPTELERAHDFLWRCHKPAPPRGFIGIFNRSHYEDVLVVRVKKLAPKEVWRARYDHINAFERLLFDSGITIVKFYLNISPDEQAERLRERQQNPDKHWKFNPGDLEDRKLWPEYMKAYEDALTRCNTPWAPWYVIPANHKWYRNLVVTEILIQTMEDMDLAFPEPPPGIGDYTIPDV